MCQINGTWVFRWLFLESLPQLLGQIYIQLVQVIFTDGDSQETSALDEAIDLFFPNARRRRCGFHIVMQGMNTQLPKNSVVQTKNRPAFDAYMGEISNWIYSLMSEETESEEKFLISRALLYAYVQSCDFSSAWTPGVAD